MSDTWLSFCVIVVFIGAAVFIFAVINREYEHKIADIYRRQRRLEHDHAETNAAAEALKNEAVALYKETVLAYARGDVVGALVLNQSATERYVAAGKKYDAFCRRWRLSGRSA